MFKKKKEREGVRRNRKWRGKKIEHRTEQKKTTEQHQNLTIRSGTTYNNK